jgi:hypothetical protein
MSILSPFLAPVENHPQDAPQQPDLLRAAIAAHNTRLIESSEGRALVLPRLVMAILGREVDRLTFLPKIHEPIAVVGGLLFRGEALDPYSLEGGWLTVKTQHSGWREVRSLAHLGELAQRESLVMVGQS